MTQTKCILDVYDVRPHRTESGREVEARVGRWTVLGSSVGDVLRRVRNKYEDAVFIPTKALLIALKKNPWLN